MTKASEEFSRAFYPFLHDDATKSQDLADQLRFSLLEKARESVDVKTAFFEANTDIILAASLAMAKAFQLGRKLLVCGNGGFGYGCAAHRRRVHAPDNRRPQGLTRDMPYKRYGDGHRGCQ